MHHEKETLLIFWRVLVRDKRLFVGSLFYFLSVIAIQILIPMMIGLTLANLITEHGTVLENILPLIVVAVFGLLANLFGYTSLVRMNAKGQCGVAEVAITNLLHRSMGFHTNNIGGKLVSNALDYPAAFGKLMDAIYLSLIPFVLIMIVGISVVMSRSMSMGLAVLVITIVTVVSIILDTRKRKSLRAARKHAQNITVANFSDTIVNAQAVKTFAQEDKELKEHKRLDKILTDLKLRDWTRTARNSTLQITLLLTMQIILIAYIGFVLQEDPGALGISIFAVIYTISIVNRLSDIGSTITNIDEGFLQASSMTEIILQQTEIKDKSDAKRLSVTSGNIDFTHVDFSYNDNQVSENVFDNLSVHISSGQKVGLVGPSGGGKSTLTRLLLRFDDVTQGGIAIDSQDLREVTQQSLRQSIAYVPQEPLLFHRSILANISYGRPDASIKEIHRAAKLAYAHDFIEKLPQKYETIVGERGVKLSGGQRQRIAIARAILKDAPILVLDEATSALDSESEVYIQKALEELMKDRTTIVIAHRLSTIQKMDRIIVLDDGKVIEDGSHKELLEKSGLYARLWAHQSGGFIEE